MHRDGGEARHGPVVVALAGRRIDAPGAPEPRFPAASVPFVHAAVREALRAAGAIALVASGACGADLVAHEAAGELGMRRRLVLPFDAARFRRSSVTDRGGDWGPRFDALLARLLPAGDVVELTASGDDDDAYAVASDAILDEAVRLAAPLAAPVLALVVWDGARGDGDLTAAFAAAAAARGIPLHEVPTLPR